MAKILLATAQPDSRNVMLLGAKRESIDDVPKATKVNPKLDRFHLCIRCFPRAWLAFEHRIGWYYLMAKTTSRCSYPRPAQRSNFNLMVVDVNCNVLRHSDLTAPLFEPATTLSTPRKPSRIAPAPSWKNSPSPQPRPTHATPCNTAEDSLRQSTL